MRECDRQRIPVIVRDADLAEQLAGPDGALVDLRGLNQIEGVHDGL
ncbi:MAG: hypothetical protein O3A90_15140 [Proteobacteria bacterium]|nr:hypothetical protein [Pseudomonadota bacterium]